MTDSGLKPPSRYSLSACGPRRRQALRRCGLRWRLCCAVRAKLRGAAYVLLERLLGHDDVLAARVARRAIPIEYLLPCGSVRREGCDRRTNREHTRREHRQCELCEALRRLRELRAARRRERERGERNPKGHCSPESTWPATTISIDASRALAATEFLLRVAALVLLRVATRSALVAFTRKCLTPRRPRRTTRAGTRRRLLDDASSRSRSPPPALWVSCVSSICC